MSKVEQDQAARFGLVGRCIAFSVIPHRIAQESEKASTIKEFGKELRH